MPARRKELSFFDRHYERGLEWYAQSYRVPRYGPIPPRVGEVSPLYMYRSQCLPRIEAFGTIDRFIVCLRNPAELLRSYYQYISTIINLNGSLEEFIEVLPEVKSFGLYAETLKPWLDRFGEERFLFLRFEDLGSHPADVKTNIASFLGIDPEVFPADAGIGKVNQTVAPRFPRFYSLAKQSVTYLYRADKSWIVKLVKKSGFRRLLVSGRPSNERSNESDAIPEFLLDSYVKDLSQFEQLTGFDTQQWVFACGSRLSPS